MRMFMDTELAHILFGFRTLSSGRIVMLYEVILDSVLGRLCNPNSILLAFFLRSYSYWRGRYRYPVYLMRMDWWFGVVFSYVFYTSCKGLSDLIWWLIGAQPDY